MKPAYWSGSAVLGLFLGHEPKFFLSLVATEKVVHTARSIRAEFAVETLKSSRAGKLKKGSASKLSQAFEHAVEHRHIVLIEDAMPAHELYFEEADRFVPRLDPLTAIHVATAKRHRFTRFVAYDDVAVGLCPLWGLEPISPPVVPVPGFALSKDSSDFEAIAIRLKLLTRDAYEVQKDADEFALRLARRATPGPPVKLRIE